MCHKVRAEELANAVRVLSASSLKEAGGRARRDAGRLDARSAPGAPKTARRNSDHEGATQSALEASVEAQSEPGADALPACAAR
jgi:hypothetical protein